LWVNCLSVKGKKYWPICQPLFPNKVRLNDEQAG
jgi:hypothetical protein